MSALTLGRLLPVYAARERRALRVYQEHQQAYELALAGQAGAARELKQLRHAAESTLGGVLEGGAMTAGDAQTALDHVVVIEQQVEEARSRVQSLTTKTQLAQGAAHHARRIYSAKVRGSHKMKEASRQQEQRETRVRAQSAEQRADEEFSTRWHYASSMLGSAA